MNIINYEEEQEAREIKDSEQYSKFVSLDQSNQSQASIHTKLFILIKSKIIDATISGCSKMARWPESGI